ncbi:hypothetical protein QJS10_CPB22g00515 [Acorus calamus]|uniref:Reverse transcriptase domain-containing protein n=1 Tax=Acorus calamus TaxID=4465 RepID=A0AAV9C153_ACOCL|nr:hypothetical protein QJS10_CPB22g00515 [Acorus calamus]
MDCLFWNIRGINSREKHLDVNNFLAKHRSPIVCLVETKVASENASLISRRILPHYRLLNPIHGGRIWILWQPTLVNIEPLFSSDQFVHCKVTSNSSQLSYFLTTVYASNNASARTILWSNLRTLAQSIDNDQWIIGGDFNEVRFSHEKIGGRGAYTRRMARFNECISDCHLQDLKALGSHFSWSNQQQFRIACKLDRILVNLTWLVSNANSFVQYLAQGLSDHTALKVSVQPSIPSGPRPFKYFQAWESHSQFSAVISRAWQQQFCGSPMYILVKKLQHLKIVLKDWNKEVFGPVQYCLQNSRQRLELAQLASLNDPSNLIFINEESAAKEEYLSMLRREESFLRQKSRQTWLMEGDRNSKFFYASIKARIAKNTLRKVQLHDGTISEDPPTIKSHAINYYRNLLNVEYQGTIQNVEAARTLSPSDWLPLCAEVSVSEIEHAVFSMKALSSPGPDGFPARFFQMFWHVVKMDFINAVSSFFQSGYLLKQINHSFISLIPKTKNAESFDNFRPISLCNVVYKTITKILAERLQVVLPKLISLNQSAFVRGRSIVHSTLLAHELVRYLHSPSSKGRSCLKVDLRKAFDSVRWDFLSEVLKGMNFPPNWIHLVLQCIQTASYSVLINGSPSGFFGSNCGLRQGDPLSPLLFVIVMQALTNKIDNAFESGKIGRYINSELNITHLSFADDLIIFMDNEVSSAQELKIYLENSL